MAFSQFVRQSATKSTIVSAAGRQVPLPSRRSCFASPFSSTSVKMTRDPSFRAVTKKTMNPSVIKAEYAVRGAIAIRAEELRDDLEAGKKLPFDSVVSCNIGNPQQLDQKPLTYLRQVSTRPLYCNGRAHARGNSRCSPSAGAASRGWWGLSGVTRVEL